jgi:sulfate transport system ATP-binding protein
MSVVVTGLTKRFVDGGSPAVSEVAFTAQSGTITTLLGPSGAGKSTVLRFIAGLEGAEAGSVIINGKDLTRAPVRTREVGFVFQNYALFRHMTVADNIGFGLSVRNRSKQEIAARVAELLALVQLDGLAGRYPAQLSGGQRQRVALARALAIRPQVLLLDEPFGALDARVRGDLRDWLLRLHEQLELTTILVTHDQDEAFELSQQVVLMFGGKVAQVGTPQAVYDHPVSPQVAQFLGGPNSLRGTVSQGRAEVGAGALAVPAPPEAREGQEVQAFFSPRDLRLTRPSTGPTGATLGKIERLTWMGARVKVVLSLPSGERVTVEVSKGELEALGVAEGDRLLVELGTAKLFLGDYAI